MKPQDTVLLAHGGGGRLTQELIETIFLPSFSNETLDELGDSARLDSPPPDHATALTTDSYVVQPLFFPGGDIGRLAVCGTVNDLAMVGARPKYLTCGMILEEGFLLQDLRRIVRSMSEAASEAGVQLVAGDTKVVPRGGADKIFINTSGVGWIPPGRPTGTKLVAPGDSILLSGTLGDHGTVVMAERENLGFRTDLKSDTAPLNGLVEALYESGVQIHLMRDPTRGGPAQALCEIATAANLHITIDEAAIPINPGVKSLADLLGLDILQIANEGKLIAFIPEKDGRRALEVCRSHPLGRQAELIGRVEDKGNPIVELRTIYGGSRIVEQPMGELLPRIC